MTEPLPARSSASDATTAMPRPQATRAQDRLGRVAEPASDSGQRTGLSATTVAGSGEGSSTEDLAGRKVGDYLVLRRIGSGAMADVYLARQEALERQIALKVLKPHLAADAAYVQRFASEARAAAGLSHANIVQIHDVGVSGGLHFIAQELIRGKNLGQLLQQLGPLKPEYVVRIVAQVAAALQRASEQQIVHRDIKPENVMVTASGEVKVTDFGLARDLMRGSDLTQVGVAMGTPLYMSPEQVEGKTLDCRSDLYSLGATAYHLLCGVPPFRGESAISVAVKHLREQPASPQTFVPTLSEDLCNVVLRLLAKHPQERFDNPRELLKALRGLSFNWMDEETPWEPWQAALKEGLPGGAHEATWQLQSMLTQGVTRDRVIKPRKRIWLRLALLGGILGLVTGVVTDQRGLWRLLFGRVTTKNMGDVWSQLYQARISDSTAAWESVLKNYPEERFAHSLALRELGKNYLQQKEYSRALEYYRQLLNSSQNDQLVATAGMAVGHFLLGEPLWASNFSGVLVAEDLDLLEQEDPWLYDQFLQYRQAQEEL